MKRLLMVFPMLLALPLVACSTVSTAPTPGQLLDAPTSLNLHGKVLTAEASPSLSGQIFSVKVRLNVPRAPLPALNITDVYVVTNDGVWSAGVTKASQWKCGATCALVLGRGPADGVELGQGVQVVLGLRDQQGRALLLRDAHALVKATANP